MLSAGSFFRGKNDAAIKGKNPFDKGRAEQYNN